MDQVDNIFTKTLNKIRHKSFGKCLKRKAKLPPVISDLLKEKASSEDLDEREQLDQQIGTELIKEKMLSIEKQLEVVKSNSKSSQSQIFKLRRMITQDTKTNQIEAIEDPKNKELILDKTTILKTTLEFASCILQNNYPTAEYQDLIESMKTLHEMKMKNNVDDGSPEDKLTMAEFEN